MTGNAAVVKVGTGMREVAAAGVSMVEAERIAREKGEGWVAVNLSPSGLRKALRQLEG